MNIGKDWDTELTDDPERIEEKLEEGPQLCAVLNKDISQRVLWAFLEEHYIFPVEINGEDRLVLLYGVSKGEPKKKKEVQEKIDEISGDYHGELTSEIVTTNGVPYALIDNEGPQEAIDSLKRIFETQTITHEGIETLAFRCFYYDVHQHTSTEPKIIAQSPIFSTLN